MANVVMALATAAALPTLSAQASKPTVVILVRHAEKAAEPANDPPLTTAGEARAKELLAAVKDAGVSAIITTQVVRTKATAAPAAQALNLVPEILAASNDPNNARVVADAIRKHAGETMLVVGHSNTVPLIIAALGAKEPAPICDASYDNLYIVTIGGDGHAGVVHARYGARTPDDQGCLSIMKK